MLTLAPEPAQLAFDFDVPLEPPKARRRAVPRRMTPTTPPTLTAVPTPRDSQGMNPPDEPTSTPRRHLRAVTDGPKAFQLKHAVGKLECGPTDRAIITAIIDRMEWGSWNGTSYTSDVGRERIAHLAGVSVSTVKRRLPIILAEWGFITRTYRTEGRGHDVAPRYQIHAARLQANPRSHQGVHIDPPNVRVIIENRDNPIGPRNLTADQRLTDERRASSKLMTARDRERRQTEPSPIADEIHADLARLEFRSGQSVGAAARRAGRTIAPQSQHRAEVDGIPQSNRADAPPAPLDAASGTRTDETPAALPQSASVCVKPLAAGQGKPHPAGAETCEASSGVRDSESEIPEPYRRAAARGAVAAAARLSAPPLPDMAWLDDALKLNPAFKDEHAEDSLRWFKPHPAVA